MSPMTDRRNAPSPSPERNTRVDTARCNAYVKQLCGCACKFHRVSHSLDHKQGCIVSEVRRLRARMHAPDPSLAKETMPDRRFPLRVRRVRITHFLIARIAQVDAIRTDGVENNIAFLKCLECLWQRNMAGVIHSVANDENDPSAGLPGQPSNCRFKNSVVQRRRTPGNDFL